MESAGAIIMRVVDLFLEFGEVGKNGKKCLLSKDELQRILVSDVQESKLKETVTTEDIEEAMATVDKNHDGELNFREYSRCLMVLAKIHYHKTIGKEDKEGKEGKRGKKGKGRGDDPEPED